MHRKPYYVFVYRKGEVKWHRTVGSFATDLEAIENAKALTSGRECRVAVVGQLTRYGMRGVGAGLQETLLQNAHFHGSDDPDLRATARQKLEQNQIF